MGTIYLPFRAATGGAYPYDDYASSLNLEYRWRLNSNMQAIGSTEASIGTQATNIVQQMDYQNTMVRVSGVTLNTADSLGQQSSGGGIVLWSQPVTLPQELTIGVWFSVPPAGNQSILSVGASPTLYQQGYHGCWIDAVGTRGVRVQFGDGNQASYTNRLSFYSAENVMPASGAVFIVFKLSRSGVAMNNQFSLYINGVLVPVPFPGYGQQGGEATTTVYGDRIVYGAQMWTSSYSYSNGGVLDEPFMTSGSLSDAQILQLYNYGSA